MPMIRETVVTTADAQGNVHVAPLGLIAEGHQWIIAPFRPSTTLDNLRAVPFAIANYIDDVRIFAGCLTGRRDWPLVATENFVVPRLLAALTHAELSVGPYRRARAAAALSLPRRKTGSARAVRGDEPRQGRGA